MTDFFKNKILTYLWTKQYIVRDFNIIHQAVEVGERNRNKWPGKHSYVSVIVGADDQAVVTTLTSRLSCFTWLTVYIDNQG